MPSLAVGRAQIDAGVIEAFLASTPLFAKTDPGIVAKVAPRVEALDVPGQGTIVAAGEQAQGIYLLFRGRATVRVVDASTGEATVRESLRVGDHFGEVGSLLGSSQPYAVVAEDPCVVLRIGMDVVDQLAAKAPGFSHAIARRLATRLLQASVQGLRQRSSMPAEPSATAPPAAAALVPAGVIPFVRVADYEITPQLLGLVSPKLIQQYQLLPLRLQGKTLTVGMVSPHNTAALADLRRVLYTVDPEVVAISIDDFSQTFVRLKLEAGRGADSKKAGGSSIAPETLVFDQLDAEREAEKAIRVIGEEVILLVNRIIIAAVEREASDIHIEAEAAGLKVKFRVAGMLTDWSEFIAPSFHKGLVARVKILAGLDVTERRMPQDGRIGVRIGRREIDLRVSSLPSGRGEKMVMRLFEAAATMRPLEHIFIEPTTLAAVRGSIDRPYGAVIVAGPTGSGKSSTLYATLNERRKTRPDSSVLTVEDPIEYRLQGITQVQVNHSIGLGFAQVLRAMLRQDPDVIMVGEIRDEETAKLALEAAMTGHLLFSSIHANNALTAIQRLENLGCNRNVIAQSLALVLVQRLARRLCGNCCRMELVAPILFETLVGRHLVDRSAAVPLPRPVGCDACHGTGYSGRVAVVESLQITEEMRAGLLAGHSLADLLRLAQESKMLVPFHRYASFLMARKVIGPNEALLTVAA